LVRAVQIVLVPEGSIGRVSMRVYKDIVFAYTNIGNEKDAAREEKSLAF